jgi:hypothetical protein
VSFVLQLFLGRTISIVLRSGPTATGVLATVAEDMGSITMHDVGVSGIQRDHVPVLTVQADNVWEVLLPADVPLIAGADDQLRRFSRHRSGIGHRTKK